jgi:Uma2 family endonuclease
MTAAKPSAVAPHETLPYRLVLDISALDMTEDQFFKLCADNGDLRLELTAKRELIIVPPTQSATSGRNSELHGQLYIWAREDGTGKTFESFGGFTLPNGAVLSPDASWILWSRWNALTEAEQNSYSPICPDFVIELRSPSDRLAVTQNKMVEYLDNGVRLGWLIDPETRRVYVYRPGRPVDTLVEPDTVSGDPVLPVFVLDLQRIW